MNSKNYYYYVIKYPSGHDALYIIRTSFHINIVKEK